MMKQFPLFLLLLLLGSVFCLPMIAKKKAPQGAYLLATDFVKANGQTDVADALQQLIDSNPNRTIYFPDGTYLLSHTLRTPADPTKAVHLVLANFAVLKAADSWPEDGGALVSLGGEFPYNSIYINGSNYGIEGGIFDGSDKADGIYIESGRETRINHVSIKHVRCGIHILRGANAGSSDADVVDVNIVGNKSPESVGVLIEGYDNTFTNMRIAGCHVGVWSKSGGNSFRNIHPLYTHRDKDYYESSIGFLIERSSNWMNFCYSDQYATGFKLSKDVCCTLTDCYVYWYSGKVPFQTAIACEGKLNSVVRNLRIGFQPECPKATVLKAKLGGNGVLEYTSMRPHDLSDEDVSEAYFRK